MIRAEVGIVIDEVHARFRANEEVVHWIKLDAAAEIDVEVVTGLVIRARVGAAAGACIKAGAQRADATDQLRVDVRHDPGRIDGIDIVKQRTIVKALLRVIVGLRRSPEDFGSDTEIVIEEHVAAKAWIGAASKGHGSVTGVADSEVADSRGLDCAKAEGKVNLLGLRDIRDSG